MIRHREGVWRYSRMHLQSGRIWDCETTKPQTRLEFLEEINSWNRQIDPLSLDTNERPQWLYRAAIQ